jgi:hypothetical protein
MHKPSTRLNGSSQESASVNAFSPLILDRYSRARQVNPPLAAGEIVTTETLTRALPVSAGETWTTELTGVGLDGICVRFA